MKNYADLGGCYPPLYSVSFHNILLDLQNSSHHTTPRSIIGNYLRRFTVVRTDQPDHSRPNENFTFNQNYPARNGVHEGERFSAKTLGKSLLVLYQEP